MSKKDSRHEKKRNMKELLATMFKIGCIGFGGGTALVPVIESEVVYEKKLIDKEEYTKDVIVANITPGALPVEVAAGVGRKVCGMPGMLLSALLMGMPGTFPDGITADSDQQFGNTGVAADFVCFRRCHRLYHLYADHVCKRDLAGMSGEWNGKKWYVFYVSGVFPDFRKGTVSVIWHQSDTDL